MARFSALRLPAALGLWAMLGLGLGASAPTGRETPPVDYLGLEDFGRRYGLQVNWLKPGRQLQLRSQWTTLEFAAGSREAAWNGHRLFLGEPVRETRGALYLSSTDMAAVVRPLLEPKAVPVPGKLELIAIDAGHGGSDPGTENRKLNLQEKSFTLDIARRLKLDLEERGYRVMLTRSRDVRLARTQMADLRRRAELANRADADLFISIHFNSLSDNAAVKGIETYALTPAGQRSTAAQKPHRDDRIAHPGNRQDHWNAVLSAAIHRHLLELPGADDRGLKRARFVVLRDIECPAVLVEAGFLSNPAEAKKISTPAYRQEIAEAIGEGIGAYEDRLREAAAVE